MPPPDDKARRVVSLHPHAQNLPLDGIDEKTLREHVAQSSARLEALTSSVDKLVEASAEHSSQIYLLTDAIHNLSGTHDRNAKATAQRLDSLAKAVVESTRMARERDAEIEKRAAAASSKASGVRTALQSYQDLEAERRKADEIAKRLADEQDRRRDAEVAEIRRRQDLAEALREAEEAKYEDAAEAGRRDRLQKADKDVGKNAGIGGVIGSAVTAIVAALNGQSPAFIVSIGIGGALLAAAFVLVVWFIRKGSK